MDRLSCSVFRRLPGWLCCFALLLLLGSGCAPKVVIQSPPPSLPAPSVQPSANDMLMARYDAWRGVPHRIGGTDRSGVDCSGFMQAVFREAFQIDLPRTSRDQSRVGRNIPVREMRPGDLVYFNDKRGDHIGVAVEGGRFLHASTTLGVTLSEFDAYWWPRLRRVQRVLPLPLTSANAGP